MSTSDQHAVRVLVLGPLALTVGGREVAVPGTKRRAVLALLALADGTTVTTTDLIDALWPDEPPRRADGALQSHVSRLRAHLGGAADRLAASEGGYRLLLGPGELDVHLARDGLAAARAVADDAPAAAAERLSAARDLWRGRPLAELRDLLPVANRCVALDDLRGEIDELLVRCALRAGDVDAALRAATTAAADRPGTEAVALLRMEALAAAGRPAEALDVAADLRAHLRDELGLEPTGAFGRLERAIAAGAVPVATSAPAVDLTAPGAAPHSIPHPPTRLVGRHAEVGAVRRLLDTERLVTIVGGGGVGKTRLAADVARRHDGDAHWVALGPLTEPDGLPHALAAALGLEAARGDVLDACARLLGGGHRLVVLDNCEHVLQRAGLVASRLVRTCPALTVLATSRQRLGLAEERTFRLGPLAVPEPSSARPERAPAMELFVDRAERSRPGLELSGEDLRAAVAVVRRLEGVPLAIELAAGRLSFLDVGDLHERLDRALDLLIGPSSAETRHRTLRATVAWSYELLPSDRQRLLRHLAVFPDGVDLATVEQVAREVDVDGDPTAALGHLVDASMLDRDLGGPARYRMLETLRAFALEQLDAASERDAAELRFLRWGERLARWVDVTVHSSDEPLADSVLQRELGNLRAVWTLALRRGALDTAIEIIVALDDAAQWRELPEVWSWAQALVDHPHLASHARRAAVLATASDFAWLQGHLGRATELADRALACATDDDGRARALIAASVARLSGGEFRAAAELALRSAGITAHPEHPRMVAALAAAYSGDLERAAAINATVVPPAGMTQQAEWEYTAAELASLAGRHAEAEGHYRRAMQLATGVGSTFVEGIAAVGLLTVHRATGRRADALRGYGELLQYWQDAGNGIQLWATLRNLADLLGELGDVETAGALLAAADDAPDAPAVGDSAWERPAVDPGAGERSSIPIVTRDDALAVAVTAIDRHLGRTGGADAGRHVRPS